MYSMRRDILRKKDVGGRNVLHLIFLLNLYFTKLNKEIGLSDGTRKRKKTLKRQNEYFNVWH